MQHGLALEPNSPPLQALDLRLRILRLRARAMVSLRRLLRC